MVVQGSLHTIKLMFNDVISTNDALVLYIYTWSEPPPPSVPSTLEQEVYREYLPEMVAEGVGLGPNALSR